MRRIRLRSITAAVARLQGFRIGSPAHKELFCRAFIDSHEAYEPSDLPWPELDTTAAARLRGLPFWSMALQAETNAGAMVQAFAATIDDPLVREAVALQGYEEGRHARMLRVLSDRYGLDALAGPPQLRPGQGAFIHFGYRECLDSFIGFGAFRIAREHRILPEALIALFSRVLWEEARHIVFFVNWLGYERTRRNLSPLAQILATGIGYGFAFADLALTALASNRRAATSFSTDSFPPVSLAGVVTAALTENDELMAHFDPRLLRPQVMPALARIARQFAPDG